MQCSRNGRGNVDGTDGATAGDAFELFDSGLGPADVVRRLRITPQAVRVLQREWADLRGGFVVEGEVATKLQRISWLNGNFPIASGDELVAMLSENTPDECGVCKKRQPQFCGHCAVARPSAVERLVEKQQIEREARRAAAEARSLSRDTIKSAQDAADTASAGAKA